MIQELKDHRQQILVLEPHRSDPRLLLSASLDGQNIIWNSITGEFINKFLNKNESGNEIAIFETIWSPNMDLAVAVDCLGFLLYFGFGIN